MKPTNDDGFETWLHGKTRGAEPEISAEFLAAQRRSIYRRLDEPRHRLAWRWALSLATVLLMLAGGLTWERRQVSPGISGTISDDQLFSDLSAMDQRTEPQAIQPIHNLFEE
jgi:hypothetical protein